MSKFDRADYDPAAVIAGHEDDVRREIDALFGAAWSAAKEEAYFAAAYRRMEEIAKVCRVRRRQLDRDGQRPLSLTDRRINEIRVENNRRLLLAALDRKMQLRYSPPPEGGVCALLEAPRLQRVK